jgi:hypothetical protein
MPRPPVDHVEPYRECLLDPLHNLRQLEPVRRLDVERNLRSAEALTAQFKAVDLPYLVEPLLKQVLI